MLFRPEMPAIQLKKLTITQKLLKLRRKYLIMIMVIILEFSMLTAYNFAARLVQANAATKADIVEFVKQTDLIIN